MDDRDTQNRDKTGHPSPLALATATRLSLSGAGTKGRAPGPGTKVKSHAFWPSKARLESFGAATGEYGTVFWKLGCAERWQNT